MSWFFCSKKLLFAKSRLFSRLRYLYVRTISFRVRARRVPRGSLVCVSLASVAARRGRIARTNENRRTWVVIPAWVSFLPVLCLSLCPCVVPVRCARALVLGFGGFFGLLVRRRCALETFLNGLACFGCLVRALPLEPEAAATRKTRSCTIGGSTCPPLSYTTDSWSITRLPGLLKGYFAFTRGRPAL